MTLDYVFLIYKYSFRLRIALLQTQIGQRKVSCNWKCTHTCCFMLVIIMVSLVYKQYYKICSMDNYKYNPRTCTEQLL